MTTLRRSLEDVVQQLLPVVPEYQLTSTDSLDEHVLWRQFIFCTLGSQVPYDTVIAATALLSQAGLPWARDSLAPHVLFSRIHQCLSAPMSIHGRRVRYRFPETRSRWLSDSVLHVRDNFGSIKELLAELKDARAIRSYLVRNMPGFGPKQSSMFLRDVGLTRDMAVIDTHIVRYMTIVCHWKVHPGSMSTLPRYEVYENKLRAYVGRWHASVGMADRTMWAVMRAARDLHLL